MERSEDRDGLEAKLLVLQQQRSASRQKREQFFRELSAEGKPKRPLADEAPLYRRRHTLSSSSSIAADFQGQHSRKNGQQSMNRRHSSALDRASLNYLRSTSCSDALTSALGESSRVPRLSSLREHNQVEEGGNAVFGMNPSSEDIVVSGRSFQPPAQEPSCQQPSRQIHQPLSGIHSTAEQDKVPASANNSHLDRRARSDPFSARPEQRGSHSTEPASPVKAPGEGWVDGPPLSSKHRLAGAANDFFLEEESFPSSPPSAQQQSKQKFHHSQGKAVHGMVAAEERRRPRRKSCSYRSAESIPLGSSARHGARHGASLASVSMDAAVPTDPFPALQTPTRRVPGSGCRLPPELTYFDWQEELDSAHARAPGGVTWDPQLEHYFAAVAATRSAGRSQRIRDGTPPESSDAEESDGSLELSVAGDCEEKRSYHRQISLQSDSTSGAGDGHLGTRSKVGHSRESSTSGMSITSAAVDECGSTSTSSSSIPPQPYLPSRGQVLRDPASLKDWMETCPVANVAQLTLARRSRLPVIFSDNAPSEGCTSSASEGDSFLRGAGRVPNALPVSSNQGSASSAEPLPPSPLKEERPAANLLRKVASVLSSDYATSEAGTSSPSEQEDSIHMGRQPPLQAQPSRLGSRQNCPSLHIHAKAPQILGKVEGGVLNAAQLILARQLHHSPGKGAPGGVYSDYVASEGCTTSSASECEASFRDRHCVVGKVL